MRKWPSQLWNVVIRNDVVSDTSVQCSRHFITFKNHVISTIPRITFIFFEKKWISSSTCEFITTYFCRFPIPTSMSHFTDEVLSNRRQRQTSLILFLTSHSLICIVSWKKKFIHSICFVWTDTKLHTHTHTNILRSRVVIFDIWNNALLPTTVRSHLLFVNSVLRI